MKLDISLGKEGYERHFENIQAVFGTGENMPKLESLDKLTIKYKLDMSLNSDLLNKLRAMLDMAEDEVGVCIVDFDEDTLDTYSECIQLLKDLRAVSKGRKDSDLWREYES